MSETTSETAESDTPRAQKYARQSSIRTDKDYYYACFATSATDACSEQTETKILRTAVMSTVDIAVCPPKDMVVQFSYF